MSIEETYNWTDGIPAEGRTRLKALLDAGKTIAIAYDTQSVDGERSIQHCWGYKIIKSYCIDGSIIHEDDFLNAVLGKVWFLDPRPLVLEPKPLEWKQNWNGEIATDGKWRYHVQDGGCWEVWCDGKCGRYRIGEGVVKNGGPEKVKAAIKEWRVNHLKSMLP